MPTLFACGKNSKAFRQTAGPDRDNPWHVGYGMKRIRLFLPADGCDPFQKPLCFFRGNHSRALHPFPSLPTAGLIAALGDTWCIGFDQGAHE
jgi:hypothetical protein